MKYYDDLKPLYLESDASGIGLGVGLLQLREGMNCGSDDVSDNTTLCLMILPIIPYPVQSSGTATVKGMHLVYYMDSTNVITTALLRRYVS